VLCIFAGVLPFSTPSLAYFNYTPALLAVLFISWLAEGNFRKKFHRIKTNQCLLPCVLCIGLYVLYLVGMLYTSNFDFGKTDLFLKLPLLLFPLIIFSWNADYFTRKRMLTVLRLFVLGNIVAVVLSLAHSSFLYMKAPGFYHFHYTNASWFHHPSYASMYYCFSFAVIAYLMFTQKLKRYEKTIGYIGIVLFLSEIILLDSRAGILTFCSIIFTCGIYIIIKYKINIKTLIFIVFLGIAIVGIYALRPHDANRMQITIAELDKESFSVSNPEKANVRILIWNAAVKVAMKNLPLGVGTGDVKDELKKQYKTNRYTIPYEENYNAHNQYLQIFATLGVAGLLSFLFILILPFRVGAKKKNILFLAFGMIICINFLVESMLEKQAGVMFFCFFFPLLYYISQQTIKQE
jgi:O-antigen ligase